MEHQTCFHGDATKAPGIEKIIERHVRRSPQMKSNNMAAPAIARDR
jgi:hypothetical protein